MFERLRTSHPALYAALLARAHSETEEPLVRDATLECLLHVARHAEGLRWCSAHPSTQFGLPQSLVPRVRGLMPHFFVALRMGQAERARRGRDEGGAGRLSQREPFRRSVRCCSPLYLVLPGARFCLV